MVWLKRNFISVKVVVDVVCMCVQVFERWMEWEPEEQAWNSYIKMEIRYKELDRARGIYERFVQVGNTHTAIQLV